MGQYLQRGNLTEAVQWTGVGSLDDVIRFVLERVPGGKDHPDWFEFIPTEAGGLIIVYNGNPGRPIILGNQVIELYTWLVDQGPAPQNLLGFVLCEHVRFRILYKDAPQKEEAAE